ncbi:MAG: class I SAM-dependent methyltransferase [Blastocatellia bacterium]
MGNILSPLTSTANITNIGKINTNEIINIYRKHYEMDISAYFSNTSEILILKCLDTGYVFYYPFTTEGTEEYYARMSKFNWYYNPSRWEHTKALELITPSSTVLEIGSGRGHFIKELRNRHINSVGLELNGEAINEAATSGITILNETIQDHSITNIGKYDIACSFQVLEHISQPLAFLEAALKCLRIGGKLIIGVPNNDSYIRSNKMYNKVLNMPPHHMGLWNLNSLQSLESLLDINLEAVYYEPLVDGNIHVYLWNKIDTLFFGLPLATKIIWKLSIHKVLAALLSLFSNHINGNSMLAVFTKR